MEHRWYLGKNIKATMGIEGGNGRRERMMARRWDGDEGWEKENGHSGKQKKKQKNEIQSVKIQSRIG